MKGVDAKFIIFSFGMGAAIASSLVSILVLAFSVMGGKSIMTEQNPILAISEIILLTLAIGTCIVSTEIYQKYQKMNSPEEKVQS